MPWIVMVLVLLVLRLPSLAEPAGGDQGLYAYTGSRIMAGGVMYRDAWDQKPPAVAFLYGLMLTVWPHESVVAGADLAAATLVALLLVRLGWMRFTRRIGLAAAGLFLLLGDPYLHRLSGIYVRGQCEPFISLAVTVGVVLLAHPRRRAVHSLAAGTALAVAFWLKYNAAAYALPVVAASWFWSPHDPRDLRSRAADLLRIAIGFATVTVIVLGYFALNGALNELRLATIDYNVRYSQETYHGPGTIVRYLFTFPFERARVEFLWFLGGAGTLLLFPWRDARSIVSLSWLAAAALSIAVNGSRDLPNYFVQADPPLALVASAGLAALAHRGWTVRIATAAVLVAALARVGAEQPLWGLRLAGLPGLVENLQYDLRFIRGRVDRQTYLERFRGQKHDVPEIDALVRYVAANTAAEDPIMVFGFSGGSVCWKSHRVSSSRFFWSRPVIIEFAADHPGYGSAGLLSDLIARPPAIVALQKDEWGSREFFLDTPRLHAWLQEGYVLDHETRMFSVWRRTPLTRATGN
ncbi:MAG TPA: hypothetical protein VM791_19800 [Vicinamibacterales bacterium]|nr:hypothetical protein [Vicinamibacterales bacterium]